MALSSWGRNGSRPPPSGCVMGRPATSGEPRTSVAHPVVSRRPSSTDEFRAAGPATKPDGFPRLESSTRELAEFEAADAIARSSSQFVRRTSPRVSASRPQLSSTCSPLRWGGVPSRSYYAPSSPRDSIPGPVFVGQRRRIRKGSRVPGWRRIEAAGQAEPRSELWRYGAGVSPVRPRPLLGRPIATLLRPQGDFVPPTRLAEMYSQGSASWSCRHIEEGLGRVPGPGHGVRGAGHRPRSTQVPRTCLTDGQERGSIRSDPGTCRAILERLE
jgi:hypothetical protein